MRKKKNVLIVAAHPDDEVLGCGGAIAKHALHGDETYVFIMAEGLTSRDAARDAAARENELARLRVSSRLAADRLGVKDVLFAGFPDNRMDRLELLDVVKCVERAVENYRPEIVYTHHVGDVNIDHVITHRAVVTACRPLPEQSVKRLLFFETPSSTEWQTPGSSLHFVPDWFVDVSDTLSAKLEALRCYESEMRRWPYARSFEAVEYLAKYRGASVGLYAAEAFMLGRAIEK